MKFDPQYPLILDVDGTLIKNDLTHDFLIQGLKKHPLNMFSYLKLGILNKPALKEQLVGQVGGKFVAADTPYNQTIIDIAMHHHNLGGQVILCSGSHEYLIEKISSHFDWISEGFGSQAETNLTGATKAQFLAEKYPEGFHYIGNSAQDFQTWKIAKTSAAINPHRSVKKIISLDGLKVQIIEQNNPALRDFLKCARIHQWAKNGLIGVVPLLTFSTLTLLSIVNIILGFFAISFLASATYIVNDLFDILEDRQHRSKRNRPIAAGVLSVPTSLVFMVVLIALSIICLSFLPAPFSKILLAYFVLTISYSLLLKKIAVIDVITLTGLFAIRVIAGASLIEHAISPWLLNFIVSFFLSLALVKRYTEVRKTPKDGVLLGRGYEKDDEPLLLSFGVMAVALSLLSFLLYSVLAEMPVLQNQSTRFILLSVLTYWLMRIWFLAHRRQLNDDPVLFAIKDKVSLILGLLTIIVVIIEQLG